MWHDVDGMGWWMAVGSVWMVFLVIDLLWSVWNGCTAWIVLGAHIMGSGTSSPSITKPAAVTGTPSAFWSAQAPCSAADPERQWYEPAASRHATR